MRVPSVPPTNLAGFVFNILAFILFDMLIMLVVGTLKNMSKYAQNAIQTASYLGSV